MSGYVHPDRMRADLSIRQYNDLLIFLSSEGKKQDRDEVKKEESQIRAFLDGVEFKQKQASHARKIRGGSTTRTRRGRP